VASKIPSNYYGFEISKKVQVETFLIFIVEISRFKLNQTLITIFFHKNDIKLVAVSDLCYTQKFLFLNSN
jgi:hypothetical protein